jgi:D-sedoheptulose 7-phosphate isomerase
MDALLSKLLTESADAIRGLHEIASEIDAAATMVVAALRQGHTVMICGNGGSCAQAMHMAAELTGHFESERQPLAAIALCADPVAMSAIGNDFGFEHVYARQVEALGRPLDVLLAISTSGNSPNVVAAAEVARSRGMLVIALTGRGGGQLAGCADLAVIVKSESTARIQEVHAFVCHLICSSVERALYPATD